MKSNAAKFVRKYIYRVESTCIINLDVVNRNLNKNFISILKFTVHILEIEYNV